MERVRTAIGTTVSKSDHNKTESIVLEAISIFEREVSLGTNAGILLEAVMNLLVNVAQWTNTPKEKLLRAIGFIWDANLQKKQGIEPEVN